MSLRYQAILFDLDETLVSIDAAFRKAYALLAKKYPGYIHPDDPAQYKQLVYLSRHYNRSTRPDAWEPFAQTWGIETPYETFWQDWMDFYTSQATPYPWSEPLLTELKRLGVKIGLVTNGRVATQEAKLRSCGLLPYFDDVIISEAIGIAKPDPHILILACKHLNVPIGECLFAGDNANTDIAGARAAGMDCLWITNKQKNKIGATYFSPDTRIILQILKGQHKGEENT